MKRCRILMSLSWALDKVNRVNGVEEGMTIKADRSREENRFKVWQQQHQWLKEIVAKFDWPTRRGNTHSQLIGGSGMEKEL